MCETDFLKYLPENLKFLRSVNGLTQEQIAEIVHVSRSHYNRIEKGRRMPDLITLCLLLDHYHISFEHIVNYDLNKTLNRF